MKRSIRTPNGLTQVAEDELHAYVDGQLPPDDRARIESYLSAFPSERERIEAYRRQNVQLHRVFDWYLRHPNEGAFDRLVNKYSRAQRRVARVTGLTRAAAVAAIVVVSGSLGWIGASLLGVPDDTRTDLVLQAAEAHVLAGANGAPGDRFLSIGNGEPDILQWIASPDDAMPRRPPDFGAIGFTLVGGRVLPTGYGPAVQLLYADAEKRQVTLFMARGRTNHDSAQTFAEDRKFSMINSQYRGIAYSLVGNVKPATLLEMANAVVAALNGEARNAERAPVAGDKPSSPRRPVNAETPETRDDKAKSPRPRKMNDGVGAPRTRSRITEVTLKPRG